ncbi:MAG TPA: hypothetical protein P5184_09260, partial [Bacteroidales bacterium]|nr:hypothetical protein [Bacteroidales bacterium]
MRSLINFRAAIILLTVLCMMAIRTFAQDGTIRGFVYDQGNGEPIIFTNVYLYQTTYGGATDVNGYFVISH